MKTAIICALTGLLALSSLPSGAQNMDEDQWDRSVLPILQKGFNGHTALRTADSELDFPAQVKAPEGAPNILLTMPDAVGFGASTPFGGPVPTEAFDRLAEDSLMFKGWLKADGETAEKVYDVACSDGRAIVDHACERPVGSPMPCSLRTAGCTANFASGTT